MYRWRLSARLLRGAVMSKTVLLTLLCVLLSACGDDESTSAAGASGGGGGGGSGGSSGGSSTEPDCFENPQTHYEIINACTTSVKITKSPQLKLLNPDGSLPAP